MGLLFNVKTRTLGLGAVVVLMAGCGGSNGGTPPTPIAAPQIACPSDQTVKEVMGTSQNVEYPAPAITGGAPPVATNCTRASGSSFPLGTTAVSCVASDAQSRQASCSFNVTLTGFTITAAKYGAYGDSLTQGETGGASFRIIDPPNSYPTKLQALFDANYPEQGIVVLNQGIGGHTVEKTVDTIRALVPQDKPEAVLVLSGFNNLTLPCTTGSANSTSCRSAIDDVGRGILDCIRKARESSSSVKYVFVSTLTPPGPTGSHRIDGNAIVQANNRVRQAVSAQSAVLVDSYSAFLGHEAEYVNVDGLHLRPAGYQALADTFFAAIRATIPQTPLLARP